MGLEIAKQVLGRQFANAFSEEPHHPENAGSKSTPPWGKNVMSAQMLEVSLLGVGTVRRLERDAWSMVI